MVMHDVGESLLAEFALLNAAATTAGTAVNGKTIDRRANGSRYMSCVIHVPYQYLLTSGVVLTMNAHLQDSPTSTAWTDFGSTVQATNTVKGLHTGATGGSSGFDVFARKVNIGQANRYVRARITPSCTVVSSVALCNYSGSITFGGAEVNPAA